MSLEEIVALGMQLAGTTTDIKWDHHVCLNVGEKMYLITTPDAIPINASVKIPDEKFEEFLALPGVRIAPYLGRYKWVEIDDISRFNTKEWEGILADAHQLIGSKLPAKKRKELGLE